MLDEEMDDIIRNAAAKHYPSYNDKAWKKMEIRLDKHLPQKKDRRKFIFFLLFFLLLGGGAFFTVFQLTGNKNPAGNAITEYDGGKQVNTESIQPAKAVAGNDNIENSTVKNAADQITGDPVNNTFNTLARDNSSTTKIPEKNSRSTVVRKGRSNISITAGDPSGEFGQNLPTRLRKASAEQGRPAGKKPGTKTNNIPPAGKTVNTVDKMKIVITASDPENNKSENITAVPADIKNEKEMKTGDEQKGDSVKVNEDKKEKEVVVTENKTTSPTDKKKAKKDPAGNLGITFSAGPDLSFIQLNKLGKATLTYGAGLSYNFKKRVTVRAGFYASKKIYTATPEQYQTPPNVNYYYLNKIDAVCKVYEIPVSLSYNFWQRKNHNWFGNAGLSSFLMKSEEYDYLYSNYGQSYSHKTAIRNENKHYFAVLTLSGGYQYQLNKRVSLQAEPYVKLPLGGIGLGKIKLNSSGILFTLTVKPFAKGK